MLASSGASYHFSQESLSSSHGSCAGGMQPARDWASSCTAAATEALNSRDWPPRTPPPCTSTAAEKSRWQASQDQSADSCAEMACRSDRDARGATSAGPAAAGGLGRSRSRSKAKEEAGQTMEPSTAEKASSGVLASGQLPKMSCSNAAGASAGAAAAAAAALRRHRPSSACVSGPLADLAAGHRRPPFRASPHRRGGAACMWGGRRGFELGVRDVATTDCCWC
jgi:hypothetical protein